MYEGGRRPFYVDVWRPIGDGTFSLVAYRMITPLEDETIPTEVIETRKGLHCFTVIMFVLYIKEGKQ